eukprot:486993-Pleurochrysis_carterae.AAC.4
MLSRSERANDMTLSCASQTFVSCLAVQLCSGGTLRQFSKCARGEGDTGQNRSAPTWRCDGTWRVWGDVKSSSAVRHAGRRGGKYRGRTR